jgi:hypothetical protein
MREPGKDMADLRKNELAAAQGLWLDLRSDEETVLAIFYYALASLFFMWCCHDHLQAN